MSLNDQTQMQLNPIQINPQEDDNEDTICNRLTHLQIQLRVSIPNVSVQIQRKLQPFELQ